MPELGRTNPCAVCPWLRKSERAWLGADTAEGFYRASVTNENNMPCHDQIHYEDPDWKTTQLPTASRCAGNLIYFRNHMKRPRHADLAAAVDAVRPSPHVFAWPIEFMTHHMPFATEAEIKQAAADAAWPFPREDNSECT